VPFDEETLQLCPGECLVVFTDGVSEALSATGEEFGEPRIVEAARAALPSGAKGVLQALISAVSQFAPARRRTTTSPRWCCATVAEARPARRAAAGAVAAWVLLAFASGTGSSTSS